MNLIYEDWLNGSRSGHTDPTEWDGNNKKCELCEKDAEMDDDYCEDHQRCVLCGENDDCDCENEFGNVSNCCEAPFAEPGYPDNDICSSCYEHACSSWEAAVEDANVKYAVKSVKELPQNNLTNKNKKK